MATSFGGRLDGRQKNRQNGPNPNPGWAIIFVKFWCLLGIFLGRATKKIAGRAIQNLARHFILGGGCIYSI